MTQDATRSGDKTSTVRIGRLDPSHEQGLQPVLHVQGTNLMLRLFNADNEVFAFLDDQLFFDYFTEGDPSLQADYPSPNKPMTHAKGSHELIVGAINWGGPAHVRYSLFLDGVVTDNIDDEVPSSRNGLWWGQIYDITTP